MGYNLLINGVYWGYSPARSWIIVRLEVDEICDSIWSKLVHVHALLIVFYLLADSSFSKKMGWKRHRTVADVYQKPIYIYIYALKHKGNCTPAFLVYWSTIWGVGFQFCSYMCFVFTAILAEMILGVYMPPPTCSQNIRIYRWIHDRYILWCYMIDTYGVAW